MATRPDGENWGDRRPILLFGASGQVGWELRRSLGPLGDVVCGGRAGSTGGPVPPADLSDADSLRRAVRAVRPRVVVNAAAYTAVDAAEADPEAARVVNAVAPGVLAEEAARCGAAFVHYSTDYVFDGSGSRPWREEDATGPLGVYGRTKLAGEEAVRAAGGPHLILRISWVYGPRGRNFLLTMLRLGGERAELAVVADQHGAPTTARAAADATAAVLARCGGDPAAALAAAGGTYHLCCGGETTWHGFAAAIFEGARRRGVPLAVERVAAVRTADYPTAAARPANSRLDCGKLAARFGVAAPHWRDALGLCLDDLLGPAGSPPEAGPGGGSV